MTFPADDYTPFGYLANPYHRARSWSETEAGLVRSTHDALGFGWVEPTARSVEREAAIVLLVRWAGRLYQTRADFARLGYRSRHHSCLLFSYDWRMDQVVARLTFALAERDALVAELTLENPGALPDSVELFLLGRVGEKTRLVRPARPGRLDVSRLSLGRRVRLRRGRWGVPVRVRGSRRARARDSGRREGGGRLRHPV